MRASFASQQAREQISIHVGVKMKKNRDQRSAKIWSFFNNHVPVRLTDHTILCLLRFNKLFCRHDRTSKTKTSVSSVLRRNRATPTGFCRAQLLLYCFIFLSCKDFLSPANAEFRYSKVHLLCPWDKQILTDLNSKAVRQQAPFKLTHKQVCVHKSVTTVSTT